MKKMIFLLLLAVFVSCSANDDKQEDLQLNGEWFLIEAACYCGFDDEIDLKDFKLRFDETGDIVHFDNPTDSYFYIAESGTYGYELDENVILIDGAEPYRFEINGSNLILTRIDDPGIADDELVLTYQRI